MYVAEGLVSGAVRSFSHDLCHQQYPPRSFLWPGLRDPKFFQWAWSLRGTGQIKPSVGFTWTLNNLPSQELTQGNHDEEPRKAGLGFVGSMHGSEKFSASGVA